MVGWRLPSAADACHVCVKLTREAAAGSPFQEGGPDGRLKQLPSVLVKFCKTPESMSKNKEEIGSKGDVATVSCCELTPGANRESARLELLCTFQEKHILQFSFIIQSII